MLLTVAAAIFGANVAEHLGAGGFQDPEFPSARGMKVLTEKFGVGNMDLTLVVRSPDGVLDPTAAAAGRRLVEKVAERTAYQWRRVALGRVCADRRVGQ